MLTFQPFYIKGIQDVEKAKGNAFGATIFFVLLMGVSTYYLWYREKSRTWNHAVLESDESESFILPNGMSDYSVEESENLAVQSSLRRRNGNNSAMELPAVS